MTDIEEVILQATLKIARRRRPGLTSLSKEQALIADLGLESLEIAELVATLEMATDQDPFAKDIAIVSIKTVGDLCRAYTRAS